MIILNLNIYTKISDFNNNDFNYTVSNIKNYCGRLDKLNFDMIEELRKRIIDIKDWIEIKSFFFNNEYYIEIYIIFNNKPITEEQVKLKDKILYVCRKFLEENNFIKKSDGNFNNSNNLFDDFTQCEFIIDICENDGSGVLDYKLIQSLFKESNIDIEALNVNMNEFSGGASGRWEEIICFIASSMASGITWDYIKALIESKLPMLNGCVKIQHIEKKDFINIRKRISKMTNIKEKEMSIVKFDKRESDIHMKFMTSNEKIYVKCNNNYCITSVKVEAK